MIQSSHDTRRTSRGSTGDNKSQRRRNSDTQRTFTTLENQQLHRTRLPRAATARKPTDMTLKELIDAPDGTMIRYKKQPCVKDGGMWHRLFRTTKGHGWGELSTWVATVYLSEELYLESIG